MSVEGINELIAKMKTLRSNSGAVIERGLLRAGNRVRNRAVMLCPVKTGELRNSIRVEKTAPLTVTVGTNKEYAFMVEYGTGSEGDPAVAHTSKEKWSWQDESGKWHTSYGTRAQPFLRPAVDRDEINKEVADTIKEAIDGA